MLIPTFDPTNKEAGLRIWEEITTNAAHIQEQVLQEILEKNANTEYLKGFLNGHHPDKELFKKKVPLVEYEDIRVYIDRIANGEPSEIICAEPIIEILNSSGTSGGRHKWLPTTTEQTRYREFFFSLIFTVINRYVEGLNEGKQMFFVFIRRNNHTPGGLVVRNGVTSEYWSNKSRNNRCFNWFDVHTCPDEIILCQDTRQSLHSQLLCGLVQRDEVVRVGALFASGFVWVIKFLEDNWQELCSNVRTGEISDWIIDPNCRKAVTSILNKQMPHLADSIELQCKARSWEGILKKLWPKAKYVEAIITGAMAQYIPTLEFYSGGLPIVSPLYASSEGYYAINMNPLSNPYDVSYTLVPNMAYYEFLALDQTTEEEGAENLRYAISESKCRINEDGDYLKGRVVDFNNVKIGQHYELVVTTFCGLYRYRMGDVLMVTNFRNNVPNFKFVGRRNVILCIDVDRTTEEDLLNAVTKAINIIEPLGFLLTDFSSYAETFSVPRHYILFWELQMRTHDDTPILDGAKMEECCTVVEQSLHQMYKKLRKRSVIGPLEIRVVKNGTFNELMNFYVSQGASLTQYKTPKGIKSEKAIQLLNARVVGRFFSNALGSQVSSS